MIMTLFHHAVRGLVAEGSRPRDVAAALGLNGQQLHQIVQQADGSEREDRSRPAAVCDECLSLCIEIIAEELT
jgi:hypothetical protein